MNDYTIALEDFADKGFTAEAQYLHEKKESFPFAASLLQSVCKYGSLTQRQLDALHKCMERAAIPLPRAVSVDASQLKAAFESASANGLKRPALRFDGFDASLAPPTGKNPGAIYIKGDDNTYYGKITEGEFRPARYCPEEVAGKVAEAMVNPLKLALAFGARTGRCSCCGRKLSDPASVENGIGPICASKFGWSVYA